MIIKIRKRMNKTICNPLGGHLKRVLHENGQVYFINYKGREVPIAKQDAEIMEITEVNEDGA